MLQTDTHPSVPWVFHWLVRGLLEPKRTSLKRQTTWNTVTQVEGVQSQKYTVYICLLKSFRFSLQLSPLCCQFGVTGITSTLLSACCNLCCDFCAAHQWFLVMLEKWSEFHWRNHCFMLWTNSIKSLTHTLNYLSLFSPVRQWSLTQILWCHQEWKSRYRCLEVPPRWSSVNSYPCRYTCLSHQLWGHNPRWGKEMSGFL